MKKILAASIAAVGFMGLAACSDTDDTTTQSVDPAAQQDSTTAPSATEPSTGGADSSGSMGTSDGASGSGGTTNQ